MTRRYLGETLEPRPALRLDFAFPTFTGSGVFVNEVIHEVVAREADGRAIRVCIRVQPSALR